MTFPHAEDSETPEIHDALRAYLREIAKHPFMTREDERELARRVRTDGDREARQKLVLSNLRLVVKIALGYHNYHNLLDLIQEGNMGLVHAVEKYDPGRGTRFSTYAPFWIHAYMRRYLENSWSIVKVSTTDGQRRLFYSLNRERNKLERSGITPSAEVLAETLAMGITEIEDMEQRLYYRDVSLEEPQHGDGDPLMETIGSGEDVEGALIEKDQTDILRQRLSDFRMRLSQRECFIFDNRIMADDPLTLEKIGSRFNTSRENVRQIQARISKKLARTLKSSLMQAPCQRAGAL